jgi:membrane-associated phospholipid phosphatase
VVGMALIILLVHGIKTWTDRPRPLDPLVSSSGSSFPSGHAAYSTLYAWIAVTVAFRVVPGITRRTLLIVASIVLAGLIGLTRGYLRVHWLSDVTSGWALGVSCFAGVAVVVLVIGHIRDNPARRERARQLDPGAGAGAGH